MKKINLTLLLLTTLFSGGTLALVASDGNPKWMFFKENENFAQESEKFADLADQIINVDTSGLEIPDLEIQDFDTSNFEIPDLEVQDFDTSDFEIPDLEIQDFDTSDFEIQAQMPSKDSNDLNIGTLPVVELGALDPNSPRMKKMREILKKAEQPRCTSSRKRRKKKLVKEKRIPAKKVQKDGHRHVRFVQIKNQRKNSNYPTAPAMCTQEHTSQMIDSPPPRDQKIEISVNKSDEKKNLELRQPAVICAQNGESRKGSDNLNPSTRYTQKSTHHPSSKGTTVTREQDNLSALAVLPQQKGIGSNDLGHTLTHTQHTAQMLDSLPPRGQKEQKNLTKEQRKKKTQKCIDDPMNRDSTLLYGAVFLLVSIPIAVLSIIYLKKTKKPKAL